MMEIPRGKIVLLTRAALMALSRVESMKQLHEWESVYIKGTPPPREGELFRTFIANDEILAWKMCPSCTVASTLGDEAYGRWHNMDPGQADYYSGAWHSEVEAVPGGYCVWILTKDA